MQTPKDSSVENITSTSAAPGKRKLYEQQRKSASSKPTRHPSLATKSSRADTERENAPAHSPSPTSKRLKTSHSSGNLGRPAGMNKTMGITSQPTKMIDLTRPSNFQPHSGAKRLVIKNLRTTSRKDVEEYYDRTWKDLDNALTAIFKREQPVSPLEVLCRGVEATCRRGRAEALSLHLKDRCKSYLEKQLLPVIENHAGPSNVDALRAVHQFWTIWNEQSVSSSMLIFCEVFLIPNCSDSPTVNLQLPRPIISPELERSSSTRRSRNLPISTCGFSERQSSWRSFLGCQSDFGNV